MISWPREDLAGLLGALEVKRGTYRWPAPAGLALKAIPSAIKDRDGKAVQTIG